MEKLIKSFVVTLSLGLVVAACSDEKVSPSQAISNDEAADDVALTLTTDVADLASDLFIIADDAENGRVSSSGTIAACGVTKDTTFIKFYDGSFVSFNYTTSYEYELDCNSIGVPTTLAYTFISDGERSSRRLTSEGVSSGSLSATGLELSASSYTLNGSFSRDHSFAFTSNPQRFLTSISNVDLSNLLVSKSTGKIEGGFASFLIVGESGVDTYEYTAEVTFNGDVTATVSIDNGVYTVNLATGEVTKQS